MSGDGFGEFFKSQEFCKNIPLLVLAVVGYLVFALATQRRDPALSDRAISGSGCWNRSTSIGLEAAANVTARGDLASALGEGFADGLDVGGF